MLRHRLIVGLAESSKIGAKLIIKRRHPLEQLFELSPGHQLRAWGLEHGNNGARPRDLDPLAGGDAVQQRREVARSFGGGHFGHVNEPIR